MKSRRWTALTMQHVYSTIHSTLLTTLDCLMYTGPAKSTPTKEKGGLSMTLKAGRGEGVVSRATPIPGSGCTLNISLFLAEEFLRHQSDYSTSCYIIKLLYVLLRNHESSSQNEPEQGLEGIIERCVMKMGYDNVKGEQMTAILMFLKRRDVFVVLPTGFGKSLCYGSLPWIFDSIKERNGSIVVVISPLIALMKDQVEGFLQRGVSAVRAGDCSNEVTEEISRGKYQLIYISPEALLFKKEVAKNAFIRSISDETGGTSSLRGTLCQEMVCVIHLAMIYVHCIGEKISEYSILTLENFVALFQPQSI